MNVFPVPTSADQFEYLLRVYFGSEPDRLTCCIDRAYRDLNRTLHGLARVPNGELLRSQASAVLRTVLTELAATDKTGLDQGSFDERHRRACSELRSTYSKAGFAEFRVGQAQKWLNMALKYVFVFGESRLPGYSHIFKLAHIPLDNIILDQLRDYGVPPLATPWSRIGAYEDYMAIQYWVRSTFSGSAPLSVEFSLWHNHSPTSHNHEVLESRETD